MSNNSTLGKLIDDHFCNELKINYIRELPIVIEGDPDFDKKTLTVTATGTSDGYRLFPDTELLLQQISVTLVRKKGKTTGTVKGKLIRDGVTINIEIGLSPKTVETVRGSFTKDAKVFDLHHALGFFGIRSNLPDHFCNPKGIDLVSFGVILDFKNQTVTFQGKNSANNVATVYAHKAEKGWQAALLFSQAKGWKAADLASELSVIDNFVSFRSGFVGIASHDSMDITGEIHAPLKTHKLRLHAGLNMAVDVGIGTGKQSPLAKVLHATFKVDDLFLATSIGPDPTSLSLEADLGKLACHIGGVDFKIVEATLAFSLAHYPGPPQLSIGGKLDFPNPSGKGRMWVHGYLAIGVESFAFTGSVANLNARIVNDIVLQSADAHFGVDPKGVTLGFGGQVDVGQSKVTADLDLLVPELTPVFSYFQIKGLHLDEVYTALFTRKAPAPLKKIVLDDVEFWNCMEQSGCKDSAGKSYDMSTGFKGKVHVLGLEADADVTIGESGLSGGFSTSKPISSGGFLLSDSTKKKGPMFHIDNSGLKADACLEIFKFHADAKIDGQGFSVKGKLPVHGWGNWTVVASLNTGHHFAASLTCSGDFRKKPISIGGGVAVTRVTVTLGTSAFAYEVDYTYKGGKEKKKTGAIKISKIAGDLKHLGREIQREFK